MKINYRSLTDWPLSILRIVIFDVQGRIKSPWIVKRETKDPIHIWIWSLEYKAEIRVRYIRALRDNNPQAASIIINM